MKCAVVLLSLIARPCVFADETQSNPLGKVFELLSSLSTNIELEGETEAKIFKEYADWCEKTSSDTNFEIKTGTATKNKLEAKIGELASDIVVHTSKVEESSKAIATAETELKEATGIRAEEHADFKASEKELLATVDTLDRAASIILKEMNKGSSAMLLQINQGTMQTLLQSIGAILDAASFSTNDRSKLLSLLESREGSDDAELELGAPAESKYDTHSNNIAELLDDLRTKADGQLDEARQAEASAKHNFEMLQQSLQDKIESGNKDLAEEKVLVSEAKEGKAVAEGDLTGAVKDLKSATENLAATNSDCMRTATDYQGAVEARNKELEVIAEGEKILKESTGAAEKQSYSFIQTSSSSKSRVDLANSEVIALVKRLAHKHNSAALSQLASRMSAVVRYGVLNKEDPFGKVRGLISDMLSKLQNEASNDASEKAYCDEETAKTTARKEELDADIEKMTSKIDTAASRSAELKEQVAELQGELAALSKAQAQMDTIRHDHHATYSKAKKELTEGINGVRTALGVLRDYYGEESKAAVLLQDDDEFGAFMQQPTKPKKHKKESGAGGGIIDILEVVEADFATNLAKEETEESDAVDAYEELSEQNKLSKVTKEKEVTYKNREAASLGKTISELSTDRDGNNEELSSVDEYYAKLNERCVAKPESYEARKEKRDAEIDGLKEAMAALENQMSFLQRKHRRGLRFMQPEQVQ